MARRRLGLGELEAQVLEVLWDDSAWLTPADVHGRLPRRRTLAYTTVLTVLVRLFDKRLLERQRAGRAYAYRPVQSRAEYTAGRMSEILNATADRAGTLSGFVATLSPAERRELLRLLERRR